MDLETKEIVEYDLNFIHKHLTRIISLAEKGSLVRIKLKNKKSIIMIDEDAFKEILIGLGYEWSE